MVIPRVTNLPVYGVSGEMISSNLETADSELTQPSNYSSSSFLYNLSLLKEKVHQVESLAAMFLCPHDSTGGVALPAMGTLIQEIIITSSSMMFACQQMTLAGSMSSANDGDVGLGQPSFYSDQPGLEMDRWYGTGTDMYKFNNGGGGNSVDNNNSTLGVRKNAATTRNSAEKAEMDDGSKQGISFKNYDIIQLDAADLLAKYTHHCHVCGKGFKRDVNLRMHMRAHGEEYKTSAALRNPMKNHIRDESAGEAAHMSFGGGGGKWQKKYSCPQEGCRWNKNHEKFQPLKSMICAKNHYKRSHCPKMYVCKRCSKKNFSVLSDLRTHEKHCGDLKWRCSCGTTFSRKDKLMGHLALFIGHAPANMN